MLDFVAPILHLAVCVASVIVLGLPCFAQPTAKHSGTQLFVRPPQRTYANSNAYRCAQNHLFLKHDKDIEYMAVSAQHRHKHNRLLQP